MKIIKYKIHNNQVMPYEVKVSDQAAKFLENLSNPGSFITGGFNVNDGKNNTEIIKDIDGLKSIVELIDKGILREDFSFAGTVSIYKKQEIVGVK